MTSGQGGYQGGQHGGASGAPGDPAQGWNAPPAPPAQYPGYAPAPSAPAGYGAPPTMERPFAVRAGIGAFMANLILGVIGSIIAFATLDTLVADALAAENVDVTISDDVLRSAVIAGYAIGLVFVALQAMFIWFAWKGRNWARIVLWVLGGLGVVSGLASLGMASAPSTGFLTALNWFGFALAVAGIVLLAQKPANEWYRYQGWLRATGQGR